MEQPQEHPSKTCEHHYISRSVRDSRVAFVRTCEFCFDHEVELVEDTEGTVFNCHEMGPHNCNFYNGQLVEHWGA